MIILVVIASLILLIIVFTLLVLSRRDLIMLLKTPEHINYNELKKKVFNCKIE